MSSKVTRSVMVISATCLLLGIAWATGYKGSHDLDLALIEILLAFIFIGGAE